MGLLDGLREALGLRAEADATRPADPDDLFQLSAAAVTMEADLGYAPLPVAGLCFSSVDSTDFAAVLEEVAAVLEGDGFARVGEDGHGYTWAVVEREAFPDLLTDVYVAADTIEERGFGDRLLAAVFGFDGENRDTEADGRVYWLYSFRRGSFYPFAPAGDHERDATTEVKLQSVLDGELDVEDDTAYWYPLWPDEPGGHPWE